VRIDAHLHFWRPSCGFDNRPVADHEAYRRDFLPADVAPDLAACGNDGSILVQTCPQVEETQWLLDSCADDERILGVTAWVDLAVPGCDYGPLLAQPKVIGVRAQLRRIADAAFVTRPAVVDNLTAALHSGLNVTILAEARHYGPVLEALSRLPDGPVTINHLGLPFPSDDGRAWRSAMRALVQRAQTYVQLSGLPFLFGERWHGADALSILDDALAILGCDRLMFASDWPMLLRFATYAEWVGAVETFCDRHALAAHERDAIFAGNALRSAPRLDRRSHRADAGTRHGRVARA
jgi:L-fuconolactonase